MHGSVSNIQTCFMLLLGYSFERGIYFLNPFGPWYKVMTIFTTHASRYVEGIFLPGGKVGSVSSSAPLLLFFSPPSLDCFRALRGAASVSRPSSGPPHVPSMLPVPIGAPRGKTQAGTSPPPPDLLSLVQQARAASQTGDTAPPGRRTMAALPIRSFPPGPGLRRPPPPGHRGSHPEHGHGSVEAPCRLSGPEQLHPEGSPTQPQHGRIGQPAGAILSFGRPGRS
ncbi:hypothetical protein NDU88_001825 [Pleurodeles waltl]|uniref:Uncharacterized protein n=1 Tax=Pleurodeles waltl TaxID=8319 RepID=A0AAV7VXI2_PLEWA|nr:hypothetical protein NDU88_001825 [Pleurodeles waltl]